MFPFEIAAHFVAAHWRARMLHANRLKRFQKARARSIIRFATTHSPFYREYWSGRALNADLGNWHSLPEIDKALMMANFARFNTQGVALERALWTANQAEQGHHLLVDGLIAGLSSGTSGDRGLFLVSPFEAAAWVGTILSRTLPNVRPGLRIAFFLRANSRLYTGASRVVHFRYFDLKTPLAQATDELNAFRPHVITGPTSVLMELAHAHRQGRLRFRPERVISGAEVMEPQDRALLEDVFGKVGEVYQATEGLLAVRCPNGALHIQEDAVLMEFESLGRGRVTPLITDLWRRTQPIVRYRLGDVLRLPQTLCPCGSDWRVIEAVEGRCADLIQFVERSGKPTPIFPEELRQAILIPNKVRDYVLTSSEPGVLQLHLEPVEGMDWEGLVTALENRLASLANEHGCLPAKLRIQLGLPERKRETKRRRVQNAKNTKH